MVSGLVSASILFLVATGLSLIFGVCRMLNLAHGSLFMFSAFLAFTVSSYLAFSLAGFWVAVLVVPVLVAAIGAVLEILVIRRFYRSHILLQLLPTVALIYIISDVSRFFWGVMPRSVPVLGLFGTFKVLGLRFPAYYLVVAAVGAVIAAGLWVLIYRTRLGILVRAAAQDREMSGACGVNEAGLFTVVFALAAWLAGVAGVLAVPIGGAVLGMDTEALINAFVVVVVGGLGSVLGSMLSAVLIGLVTAFGILIIPQFAMTFIFGLMALVLIFRPTGLLGKASHTAGGEGHLTQVVARPALGGGRQWWAAIPVALLLLVPLAGESVVVNATDILLFALVAVSLNLLVGYAGMVSLGHAAYFALGGYTAGVLAKYAGLHMAAAVALAPLVAGLAATVIGFFCIRLTQAYFIMLTLAFGQLIYTVVWKWKEVTGGDDGLIGIGPPAALLNPVAFYYLTVPVTLVSLWVLYRFCQSPFGFVLRAIKDNPTRTAVVGVPVKRFQLAAFAMAGFFAGIAGALYVFHQRGIFPNTAFWLTSTEILLMVVLGGASRFSGPIVGAVVLMVLRHLIPLYTEYWFLVLGLLVMLVALKLPHGLTEFWVQVRAQRRRGLKEAA